MKHEIPEEIKKNGFACFGSLNQAERACVLLGDEAYRESLDLENDDAPCWQIPSGEHTTFAGWNPQCVPTMDYIVWKLKRLDGIIKGEIIG